MGSIIISHKIAHYVCPLSIAIIEGFDRIQELVGSCKGSHEHFLFAVVLSNMYWLRSDWNRDAMEIT